MASLSPSSPLLYQEDQSFRSSNAVDTSQHTVQASEEEDENKFKHWFKKHKEQLQRWAAILGAVVGIVSLILSCITYAQVAGFVQDYDDVVKSWETSPLMEVQFVDVTPDTPTDSSCPPNFEPVLGYWPGTHDACNCILINRPSEDKRACTDREKTDGCSTLPGLPSIGMDLFPLIRLCIRRSGPSALDRNSTTDCNNSTSRICGEGSGQICWPISEPLCPITDMGFLISNVSLNETGADGSYFLPNGYFFYYKRGGTLNSVYFNISQRSSGSQPLSGLPIVNLAFQTGDPCTLSGCGYSGREKEYQSMQDTYQQANTGRGYMLQNFCNDELPKGCEKPSIDNSVSPDGRDIRYITLHSITEQTLYSNYTDIPIQFVTSDTTYLYVFAMEAEVLWFDDCPESRSTVKDQQDNVNNVRAVQLLVLLFSIITFFAITCFFSLGAYCVQIPRVSESPRVMKCWNRSKPYEKKCKYSLKVLAIGCTLASMIMALSALWFWEAITNYNQSTATTFLNLESGDDVVLNSCSDPLTDETFTFLSDTYDNLSYKNIWNTVSWSVTGAFDTILDVLGGSNQKF